MKTVAQYSPTVSSAPSIKIMFSASHVCLVIAKFRRLWPDSLYPIHRNLPKTVQRKVHAHSTSSMKPSASMQLTKRLLDILEKTKTKVPLKSNRSDPVSKNDSK